MESPETNLNCIFAWTSTGDKQSHSSQFTGVVRHIPDAIHTFYDFPIVAVECWLGSLRTERINIFGLYS